MKYKLFSQMNDVNGPNTADIYILSGTYNCSVVLRIKVITGTGISLKRKRESEYFLKLNEFIYIRLFTL